MKINKDYFNIPNLLCYFRILLIPVFLYTYFTIEANGEHLLSTVILIVSGLSDFLDGFIARKFNMITEFGKLIDPVADKLTQLTVALTLMYTYPFYMYLAIIIVIKDGMLALGGIHLLKKRNKYINQAKMPGKVATLVFYMVSILLVAIDISEYFISNILILITIILMFFAMVHYARHLIELYNEDKHG